MKILGWTVFVQRQVANSTRLENYKWEWETAMKKLRRCWLGLASCLTAGAILAFIAHNVFADAPQPGITISSLGGGEFTVTVTNSLSTTNYTLFWVPQLGNPSIPWEPIYAGAVGQSNFTVDASGFTAGFFRAALVNGGSVPPWEAADPSDPNSPILSVSITIPADGSTVQ